MTRACNIYIVDDDLHVRESLRVQLTALGFDTFLFAAGADFAAASGSLQPGCLLLDVNPPADGFGVLRHLESDSVGFRAVMMSGSPDPMKVALAAELGAVGWLDKPFAKGDLLEAIEKACSRIAPVTTP